MKPICFVSGCLSLAGAEGIFIASKGPEEGGAFGVEFLKCMWELCHQTMVMMVMLSWPFREAHQLHFGYIPCRKELI